jgi:hypothetical protein
LPYYDLVELVIANQHRRSEARQLAAKPLKFARVTAALITGKRCATCHAYKYPVAYSKCAPRSDGLQSSCNQCLQERAAYLRVPGNLVAGWRAIVDAKRAANADAKPLGELPDASATMAQPGTLPAQATIAPALPPSIALEQVQADAPHMAQQERNAEVMNAALHVQTLVTAYHSASDTAARAGLRAALQAGGYDVALLDVS